MSDVRVYQDLSLTDVLRVTSSVLYEAVASDSNAIGKLRLYS